MAKGDKGKNTRRLIINQAALLFTKNGYNHTSLTQILEATRLAKGGFYFHFTSKEELGCAVIKSLEEYWYNTLLPNMQKGQNAIEKLQIMLSSPGDCHSSPDCIRPTILLLNLATEMIEVNDLFSSRLKEIFQEWWKTLECIIGEGKSTGFFKAEIDASSVA